MSGRSLGVVCGFVLCATASAFAHGGVMRTPFKTPGTQTRNAGSPQSGPVGRATPARTASRWEAWWASNKELFLRDEDRKPGPAVTPSKGTPEPEAAGSDGATPSPTEQELYDADRAKRRRHRLAGFFLKAMEDPGAEVRAAAAIALGKTGDPRGREVLEDAARNDFDELVRESATLGLGVLGDEASTEFLERLLLREKTPFRRRAFAAFSLGLVGGDRASGALSRFVLRGVGKAQARTPGGHELLASAFVGLGLAGAADAPEFLLQSLASERHRNELKPFILVSLGRAGDPMAHSALTKVLLSEKHTGMRRAAAIALPGVTTSKTSTMSAELLLSVVRDDVDPVARHYAATSLGALDVPVVRDELRRMLTDRDRRLHPFAALALGRLGDLRSAPTLRKLLAAETVDGDRASYCLALALLRDKEAIPLVKSAFTSPQGSDLKGYAALSLGMLGAHEAADDLFRWVYSTRKGPLHVDAALGLAMLGDPRLIELLRDVLVTARTDARLGSVVSVIGMARIDGMEGSLLGLYRMGDPREFYTLKERELRRAFAVVGLGMLADRSETPRLSSLSIGNDFSLRLTPLREVLRIL